MKTWTNPTVEELEVKMTANGEKDWYVEDLTPIIPDLPLVNDDLTTGKDSNGDGYPTQEGTPS